MVNSIEIFNLYKEYKLGVIGHGTIYRDLQSWWAKILKKPDPNSILGSELLDIKNTTKSFLALDDINLKIRQGDIVGIIGANGAGKSTLLKILSRITLPTKGYANINGKVSSLLEVGTGFHPELTGKENIYLNGAINGMTKSEVDKNLGAIIEFAGVKDFLNTPVKRYSSGMLVRLGFAVAAFLDSDIMFVDEVLAVGDQNFKKKAEEKMKSSTRHIGKTILFVSHNLDLISSLCNKVVLLEKGKIIKTGNTDDVINYYLGSSTQNHNVGSISFEIDNKKLFNINKVSILDEENQILKIIDRSKSFKIKIDYTIKEEKVNKFISLGIYTGPGHNNIPYNMLVLQWSEKHHLKNLYGKEEVIKTKGNYQVEITVPGNILTQGNYKLTIYASTRFMHFEKYNDLLNLNLVDYDSSHNFREGISSGLIALPLNWDEKKIEKD